jgi:hypothetical protein
MYSPRLDTAVATRPDQHSEGLNRLIAAAVVNQTFCDTLLNTPEFALENGYFGEKFNLEDYEKALILSIEAEDLSDFANQITERGHEELQYQRVSGSSCWVPAEPAMVVMDSN